MKAAKDKILWSGDFEYTLTAGFIASDPMHINFSDAVTVYIYYAAGATETGNVANISFEANPFTEAEDPTGAFWAPFGGIYTDAAGTWSEENSVFNILQGTASVYEAGEPIHLNNTAFDRLRVKAQESGKGTNFGTIKVIVVKHNKNQ